MTTETHPGTTKAPDTAAFNHWIKSALADPKRAIHLKTDWRKLMHSELALTEDQRQHLFEIPDGDAKALQLAVAKVVDHGGTIHVERHSETSPGTLVVRPNLTATKHEEGQADPALSVGVFHCTFNAHCRNWHCGWGPSKSK